MQAYPQAVDPPKFPEFPYATAPAAAGSESYHTSLPLTGGGGGGGGGATTAAPTAALGGWGAGAGGWVTASTAANKPPKESNSNSKVTRASFASPVPVLGYSKAQRRRLDASLIHWLYSSGLLSGFIGGFAPPCTVLALEGPIR